MKKKKGEDIKSQDSMFPHAEPVILKSWASCSFSQVLPCYALDCINPVYKKVKMYPPCAGLDNSVAYWGWITERKQVQKPISAAVPF